MQQNSNHWCEKNWPIIYWISDIRFKFLWTSYFKNDITDIFFQTSDLTVVPSEVKILFLGYMYEGNFWGWNKSRKTLNCC